MVYIQLQKQQKLKNKKAKVLPINCRIPCNYGFKTENEEKKLSC